jgi:hypothetical protein
LDVSCIFVRVWKKRFGCCLQGLRVFLELFEVEHVDGEARRRLFKCSEGLKWSSCYLRIPTYGHLKVVVYSLKMLHILGEWQKCGK